MDEKLQRELLRMLRQAEQAARVGHADQRQRWLNEYVAVLGKASNGLLLPASTAKALILIASSL